MFNKVIEILEKDYAYNSKNDCGFSEFQKLLIKDVIDIVSNRFEQQVSLGVSQPVLLADIKHEIENIEYCSMAEGCGLEDRNITDRYEAMAYGWDRAIEKVLECFPE